MPIIAIARCRALTDYETSVRRAGGTPLVLETQAGADASLAGVDGLVLTGGGDVLPSLYGAAAHPSFDAAERGRDDYELALLRLALAADTPVLAICRGIQVLNVARGGTLIQHIPDDVGVAVNHRIDRPPVAIAHDVRLEAGSRLDRLLGPRTRADRLCGVNSRHHQAVGILGHGLVATATAPDGVVEGVEDPSHRFCVGVQWHPENFWRTGAFGAVFEGLVQACR